MYDPTKPYKKQILDLIKKTWETPYYRKDEAGSTDGLGTKGIYYWKKREFKNPVIDSLAMNLNDLILERATAYKLKDHIFLPEDDKEAILEIIKNLSEECIKRNIFIQCGETAVHNDMSGLEISISVDGFIKKPQKNIFLPGDNLIGIASSGLHSNGFTLVRKLFEEEFRKEFIEPTLIYYDALNKIEKKKTIHGMAHITGGAFTKLKDFLDNSDALIHRYHKLSPQLIFTEIYNKGIKNKEMYENFNCGIGFILSVPNSDSDDIILMIEDSGFKEATIGKVVPGNGKITIESMFNKRKVEF